MAASTRYDRGGTNGRLPGATPTWNDREEEPRPQMHRCGGVPIARKDIRRSQASLDRELQTSSPILTSQSRRADPLTVTQLPPQRLAPRELPWSGFGRVHAGPIPDDG